MAEGLVKKISDERCKRSAVGSSLQTRTSGAKHGGNEVLVCAFTYTNEDDEAWMKNLFKSITYIGAVR